MKEIKYKINHEIKNQEIRLVFDQENKIISLSDALEIAKNRNLDLICINDKVDPVICKIDNYKKLKFDQKKKQENNLKNSKQIKIKCIQLSFRIEDHDLKNKMKRIEEFLQAKNKVEIVFLLRKRDKEKEGNVQLAFKKIDNILENLSQYKVEQMPKLQSRSINFTLAFK